VWEVDIAFFFLGHSAAICLTFVIINTQVPDVNHVKEESSELCSPQLARPYKAAWRHQLPMKVKINEEIKTIFIYLFIPLLY
jgi:hypothetical protein